jgi:Tol biopolymer transport system component
LPLHAEGAGDEQKSVPFLTTQYNEIHGQFQPGTTGVTRWIAYVSDESGQNEIYVQSFPAGTRRFRISLNGGAQPRWRRDGKELFYIAPDGKLMAVDVRTTPQFDHGVPKPLFESRMDGSFNSLNMRWAPTPDGKRFLIVTRRDEAASTPVMIVLNWQAALKQ